MSEQDLCNLCDFTCDTAEEMFQHWREKHPVEWDGLRRPSKPAVPSPGNREQALREEKRKEYLASNARGDRESFYAGWDAALAAQGDSGALRIANERKRQIEVEGWTSEHDQEHSPGTLALAGACYATPGLHCRQNQWPPPSTWPWDKKWWKPSDDKIRNLEKAGALIAAEIDRMLAARPSESKETKA